MFRPLAALVLSILALGIAAPPAPAQDNLLRELYGLGVHSYFSGEYREAYENLTAAVEGGSRDPRVYYFRGLAQSELGRPEDAKLDYQHGAMMEVAGGGDQYPIGRSLERIQGVERILIERTRKIVQIKHRQEQVAKAKDRYEERRTVEEPVIANQPKPKEVDDLASDLAVDAPAAEGNPFGGEKGLGEGAAEEAPDRPMPTDVAGDAAADPFGGDAGAPADADPGAGDPFGAEKPPADAGGDPFGGGADPFGGAADPFGGAPDKPQPADDGGGDPFGGAPPPDAAPPADDGGVGGDPFGGAAEPADAPPAAAPPADGGGDPFGGAAEPAEVVPDEDAGGGDPFGGAAAVAPRAGDGLGMDDIARGVGAVLTATKEDNRDPFDNTDEPKAGGGPAPVAPPVGGDPAPTPGEDLKNDPFADDPAAEGGAFDPFN